MTCTKYMHDICHTYTRCSDFSVLTGFKEAINVGWIVNTYTQHVIPGQQLDSTQKAFTVRQDIPGIFMVYSCIYYAYTMRWSLVSPLSCPSALGSLRPGLPSKLLSFGHKEAAHTRLGPSKVPQPGVDLVNMAAPPLDWASTTGIDTQKRASVGCCTYVK